MPAIIQCPNCGKETYRELQQCPHCGHALPEPAPLQSSAMPHAPAAFQIGTVVSGAFSAYFSNFVRFGTLAVILLSPVLLVEWLILERGGGALQARSAMREFTFIDLVHFVLSLMLFSVLTASITFGTFQSLRGREVRVSDCLSWGLSRAFPVIGVSLVAGVAAALAAGVVFLPTLIVPYGMRLVGLLFLVAAVVVGLLVMLRYWVAVPATVVERDGVFASLGRSVGLTRDCRGKIFLIAIIYFVLFFLFMLFVGFAIGLTSRMMPSISTAVALAMIATFIANSLGQAFGSVLTCVCYYELRRSKEGVDAREIAAVFD